MHFERFLRDGFGLVISPGVQADYGIVFFIYDTDDPVLPGCAFVLDEPLDRFALWSVGCHVNNRIRCDFKRRSDVNSRLQNSRFLLYNSRLPCSFGLLVTDGFRFGSNSLLS